MYIVKAIAIVGGDETYTFDNKQDALEKVRWFKDLGGFIVTMTELTQETVS
jgi:putative intracellular protease/amidase